MKFAQQCVALTLTLLSLTSQAAVTEVTASVDKNPAMVDESIVLDIVANDEVNANSIDTSALLKDFVVGRTSVSRQTQIINFDTSKTTRWSTTLIPRQPGMYTIPSFTVAGQTTQPISLQVLPVSASKNSQGRDLFITTEVDMSQVYLHQQIKYVAKLHLAMDLQRGSLATPTLTDADIRQIGQDSEYSDIVNGRRYRIIERRFAIIPQKSGKFVIDGPLFEGEVVTQNRQTFGFFNRTKTVTRAGKSIEIEVLPVPANFKQHWLPSEFVQLTEEWQPANGNFVAGEPITRTLTLTAMGLVEEQLPEIGSQYPTQVKTYPDQANTATVERDGSLIAQRVESIAIIPGKAGQITFPEVRVPWFNVVTKKTDYAILPAKTIQVSAATVNGNAIPIAPVAAAPANVEPQASPTMPIAIPPTFTGNNYWSISSWVLLFIWLITLLLWRRSTVKSSAAKRAKTDDGNEKQCWGQLQSALSSNDNTLIHQHLSLWLAEFCGAPKQSLAHSQDVINNPDLNAEIDNLLASLFGKQERKWQAEGLKKIVKAIRQDKTKPTAKAGTQLKQLYPQQAV